MSTGGAERGGRAANTPGQGLSLIFPDDYPVISGPTARTATMVTQGADRYLQFPVRISGSPRPYPDQIVTALMLVDVTTGGIGRASGLTRSCRKRVGFASRTQATQCAAPHGTVVLKRTGGSLTEAYRSARQP